MSATHLTNGKQNKRNNPALKGAGYLGTLKHPLEPFCIFENVPIISLPIFICFSLLLLILQED